MKLLSINQDECLVNQDYGKFNLRISANSLIIFWELIKKGWPDKYNIFKKNAVLIF